MSETDNEKVYIIVTAGRGCPVCGNYGLFYVGDEEHEDERITYRCETCLTRFDSEKRAIKSAFITKDGLDENHMVAYFGRWMDEDKLEVIRGKLEALAIYLKEKGEI